MNYIIRITAVLGLLLVSACASQPTDQNGNPSSVPSGPPITGDLPAGSFASSGESGFSGDVYVRGYADIETVDEPFCIEDCEQFQYVFFNVLETGNDALRDFLTMNEGNAYARESGIGIGCDENGAISYVNHSEEHQMRAFTLPSDVSAAILASSEDSPVTLHLTKLPLSGGTEAPACYGHFTEIELADN